MCSKLLNKYYFLKPHVVMLTHCSNRGSNRFLVKCFTHINGLFSVDLFSNGSLVVLTRCFYCNNNISRQFLTGKRSARARSHSQCTVCLSLQGGDTPIYSVLRSSSSVKMKVKGQAPKIADSQKSTSSFT